MHYFTPGDVFKDERTEGPIRSTERPRDACKRGGRGERKGKKKERGGEGRRINTPPGCENAPNFRTNTVSSCTQTPKDKKKDQKTRIDQAITPPPTRHDDDNERKDEKKESPSTLINICTIKKKGARKISIVHVLHCSFFVSFSGVFEFSTVFFR